MAKFKRTIKIGYIILSLIIKKVYTALFRTSKNVSQFLRVPEYHSNIDSLPVLNWHKIKETGDFKWLLKSTGNIGLLDIESIWYKIEEEFFNEFGATKEFKKWYMYHCDYYINMAKSYIENDPTYKTFALVAQAEAKSCLEDIQGGSFNESLAITSKFMGSQIDPSTTTVRQFYSYLQLMRHV